VGHRHGKLHQISCHTLTQGSSIKTRLFWSQAIDANQMLTGNEALFKVQITHCGDDQTLLGITMARVLSGTHQTISVIIRCYSSIITDAHQISS